MSDETSTPYVPSWLRSKPNCCETCVSWQKDDWNDHVGACNDPISLDSGEKTDSRYRCPCFKRKENT